MRCTLEISTRASGNVMKLKRRLWETLTLSGACSFDNQPLRNNENSTAARVLFLRHFISLAFIKSFLAFARQQQLLCCALQAHTFLIKKIKSPQRLEQQTFPILLAPFFSLHPSLDWLRHVLLANPLVITPLYLQLQNQLPWSWADQICTSTKDPPSTWRASSKTALNHRQQYTGPTIMR